MPGTTLILDQDGPAITPPNGEVSDFDNDGSHEIIEVALITCAVLVALSVLSRVWSRLSMKPRLFGIEEGLLICALVSKDLFLLYINNFQDNKLTFHSSGHLFQFHLYCLSDCYLSWHFRPPVECQVKRLWYFHLG